MRGKHKRARENRQQRELQAEIEQLRDEIAAEQRKAKQAADGAERTRLARQRLVQEQAATDATLGRLRDNAQQRAAAGEQARESVASALRKVRRARDGLLAGDGGQKAEVVAQAGLKLDYVDVHPSATPDYREAWYRKKIGGDPVHDRNVSLQGWIPPDTPEDAYGDYALSTVREETPAACWTWAVPPWMSLPADSSDAAALRAQFGTTSSGAPAAPRARAFPGPRLRDDAVLTSPWRHLPLITHPADAADLSYWYYRSAWSQRWAPVEAGAGATFWLPGEHAVSYPTARALPDDVDVRLPYPLVFAVLAAPWALERNTAHDNPVLRAMWPLFVHARGEAAHGAAPRLADVLGRLQAVELTDRVGLPTPLETLDAYGGYVEGLLLTADEQGRPGDEFAWCVVILHPMGFPLGRISIPASRARSAWSTQVGNIITGIALSTWHDTTALPARHHRHGLAPVLGAAPDRGAVHILDIDRTSPRSAASEGDTGRSQRPHWRRGHWRHQPVGVGRRHRHWTWVRPGAVHGGGGEQQVYVLRP